MNDPGTVSDEASGKKVLGRLLRDWRTARQLSLDQLAARASVAKSTLSTWETGTHQPCLVELAAVETMRNGGDVFDLRPEEGGAGESAEALLRY